MLKDYLSHLNPTSDALFQRPRDGHSKKFNPADDKIWFSSAPLGTTTLDNMMKEMSKRAGIEPHLPNHCLRATSFTVLSNHNCETRHIKSIMGHKSDQAVESNKRPLMEQQQKMSPLLCGFIGNTSSGDVFWSSDACNRLASSLRVCRTFFRPDSTKQVTFRPPGALPGPQPRFGQNTDLPFLVI